MGPSTWGLAAASIGAVLSALVDALTSTVRFQPLPPGTFLSTLEDTPLNITSLALAGVASDAILHVLVACTHGTLGSNDASAWVSARTVCASPTSFVIETTLSNANAIMKTLVYTPNAHYNFDWSSGLSSPCVHRDQSPETVYFFAVEAAAPTNDALLASCGDPLSPSTVRHLVHRYPSNYVAIPVSIVAVNNPPSLALPTGVDMAPASCTFLDIVATDLDVDEVANGAGMLTFSMSVPASSAQYLAFASSSLVRHQLQALSMATLSYNSVNTTVSAIVVQGPVAGVNAWLRDLSLCVPPQVTSASWTLSIADSGNCGSSSSATATYSIAVSITPTMMPTPALTVTTPTPTLVMTDPTVAVHLGLQGTAGQATHSSITFASQFGYIGVPTLPPDVAIGDDRYITDVSLHSTGIVAQERITVSSTFTKEVQLLRTTADTGSTIVEAVVVVSLTYLGTTTSAVVDLTDEFGSATAVAKALQSELTNAGDIAVSRSPPDAQGGCTWSITFTSLSGSTIPLLQATVQSFPAPWSGVGSPVTIVRATAGSLIPPVVVVTIPDATVQSGTFELSVGVDAACNGATSASFATNPLPFNALATDVQAALTQGFIGTVVVSKVASFTWHITFVANTYVDCLAGVVVVPQFRAGTGAHLCSTCQTGIPSMTVQTLAVGSKAVLPTDTWQWTALLNPPRSVSLPLLTSPYAVQQALYTIGATAEVSTSDCVAPTLQCTWTISYNGAPLEVSLGPTTGALQLQHRVLSQGRQPLATPWTLLTNTSSRTGISVHISDARLTQLVASLVDDATATTMTLARDAYDVTWRLSSARSKHVSVTTESLATVEVHTTPELQAVQSVPGQEHHLVVRLRKTPALDNVIEQVALQCNAIGGSFTMKFRGVTSAPIPTSSTLAQLADALSAMPTLPNVFVPSSSSATASICGNTVVPIWLSTPTIVQLSVSATVQPAIQTLQLTVPLPPTGSVTVFAQWTYAGATTTAPLVLIPTATTSSASALQQQLTAAFATIGDVIVTPSASTHNVLGQFTWDITHTSLHGPVIPLVVLNTSVVGSTATATLLQPGNRSNAVATVVSRNDQVPFMGTFRLQMTNAISSWTSTQLAWQASATDLQLALRSIPALGAVRVTSTAVSTTETHWQITFLTSAAAWTVAVLWNDGRSVQSCADCVTPTYPYTLTADPQLHVTTTPPDAAFDGAFSVCYNGGATDPLPLRASATTVESALNALLSGAQQVVVTALPTTSYAQQWLVTFLSLNPTPPLTVDTTNVSGSGVHASINVVQSSKSGAIGNVPPLTLERLPSLVFPDPITAVLRVATVQNGSHALAAPYQALQLCSTCLLQSAQQTLQLTSTVPMGGNYQVSLLGASVMIPITASQSQVLLLLNTLTRVVSVVVTATVGLSYQCVVTFDPIAGIVPKLSVSVAAVTGANVQASVVVNAAGNAVGGTFAVRAGGRTTHPVAVHADAEALQRTLGALLGSETTVFRSASPTIPNGYCWAITFYPDVSIDVDVVRGCDPTPMAACGLTGAGADIQRIELQHLEPPDSISFAEGDQATTRVPVGASALDVQRALQSLPSFSSTAVVKAPSVLMDEWYITNYSTPAHLQVVGHGLTATSVSVVTFYRPPLRLTGPSLSLAASAAHLCYQPHLGLYNHRVDTIVITTETGTTSLDVIVPPASTGHLVASDLPHMLLVPFTGSLRVPSVDLRYVAFDTLSSVVTDVALTDNVSVSVLVTSGVQLDLPFHRNAHTWTYNGTLVAAADALRRLQLQRSSPTADPAVISYREKVVLGVSAALTTSPPVALTVSAPQGAVSGTMALRFDVNDIVEASWCTPRSRCQCSTDAIAYPFEASVVETAIEAMTTRCSQVPTQRIQTLQMRFPAPVATVPPEASAFSLQYAGHTTQVLSGQSTPSAVLAALLALPSMASIVGKLVVTTRTLDAYTLQYIFTFDASLASVAPLTVATSMWFPSNNTLTLLWVPQPSLRLHFAAAVTCTGNSCTLQFLADLPVLSVASSTLTTTVGPPPTVTVTGGRAALMDVSLPAFLLLGTPFPLPTTESRMQAALAATLGDSVVVTKSTDAGIVSWQITYSAVEDAVDPTLGFVDLQLPHVAVTMTTIDPGVVVACSNLTIVAATTSNTVERSMLLRLDVAPVDSTSNELDTLSPPPVVCYMTVASGGSLLTTLPGTSLALSSHIHLVSSTADAVVHLAVTTLHGIVWVDPPHRDLVEYIAGSPFGDQALELRATASSLALALSSLLYKAPTTYAGNDSVTIVVAGNTTVPTVLSVVVAAMDAPPSLSLERVTLRLYEDTAASLPSFSIAPSPYTRASCATSTVYNVTLSVDHGTLSFYGYEASATLTFLASAQNVSAMVTSTVYRPLPNYAGLDAVTIGVRPISCLASTSGIEASAVVALMVEAVPDPILLSLAEPANNTTVVHGVEAVPLPTVVITVVDATPLTTDVFVRLQVTTQVGSVTFGATPSVYTPASVYCRVEVATSLLAALLYRGPATGSGNDSVTIRVSGAADVDTSVLVLPVIYTNAPPPLTLEKAAVVVDEDGTVSLKNILSGGAMDTIVAVRTSVGWLRLGTTESSEWTKSLRVPMSRVDELLYKSNAHYNGDDSVSFTDTSGVGVTLPVAVLATNDPPTLNGKLHVSSTGALCGLQIDDVDGNDYASNSYVLTLQSSKGYFSSTDAPGIRLRPVANGMSLQGTLEAMNRALRDCVVRLTTPTPANVTVCVKEYETLMADPSRHNCLQSTLEIPQRAPTPPELTASATQVTVLEDSAVSITPFFTVSNVDDAFGTVTAMFTGTTGTFDLSTMAPSGCATVTGNSVTGRPSCVASALATQPVLYRPAANVHGPDVITVALGSTSVTLSVWIQSVNDPPVWRVNTTASVWRVDAAIVASHMLSSYGTVHLDDRNDSTSDVMSLTLAVDHGTLTYTLVPGTSLQKSVLPPRLVVQGTVARLNVFVASLEYTPSHSTTDVLSLSVVDGSVVVALDIDILVACLPQITVATTDVAVTVGATTGIDGLSLPLACGSRLQLWTLELTALAGTLYVPAQPRATPYIKLTQSLRDLDALLRLLQYTAPAQSTTDTISLQLSSNDTALPTTNIVVQVQPQYTPPTIVCAALSETILADAAATQAFGDTFLLQGGSAATYTVAVSGRSPVYLQLDPTSASISASTFAPTTEVHFSGLLPHVQAALSKLAVHSNYTGVLPTTVNLTVTIASVDPMAPAMNATCSVVAAIAPTNHAPRIQAQPGRQARCGVRVDDIDVSSKGWASLMRCSIATLVDGGFGIVAQLPPTVRWVNETMLGPGQWRALTFEAPLEHANLLLGSVLLNATSGSIEYRVDDLAHGTLLRPHIAYRTIECRGQRVGPVSTVAYLDSSNQSCAAGNDPCLLQGVDVTPMSTDATSVQVSATAVVGFTPSIQVVQTTVDGHQDQVFDVVVATPAAGTITMRVTWQRPDGLQGQTAFTVDATAVATMMEEISGLSAGQGLGGSMQSQVKAALPTPAPARIEVTYGPSSRQHWKVAFVVVATELWTFDMSLVATTGSISVSVQPSALLSHIAGSFELLFQGIPTAPVAASASALDMQLALEAHPLLHRVAVTRTRRPDTSGGFAWTITFLDAAYDLPVLSANTAQLQPQPAPLLGAGNRIYGSAATVHITSLQDGYGTPDVYDVVLSAQHVNPVLQIAVVSSASRVTGDFSLQVAFPNGTLRASTPVQYNAVAMIADEGIDTSLGGRPGQSLQAALATMLPGVGCRIQRTGPVANGGYTWSITLYNSPASLPPLSVVSTSGGLRVADVVVSTVTAANALGGTFVLSYRNETSAPIPYDASSSTVASALGQLPTISCNGRGRLLVRDSDVGLESGRTFSVVFLARCHESLFETDIAPIVVDGTGLTGLGASAVVRSTVAASYGTLRLASDTSTQSRSDTVLQRHAGLDLMLQGRPRYLNPMLRQLLYTPDATWFGTLELYWSTSDGVSSLSWTSPAPQTITVRPPTRRHMIVTFHGCHALEDMPLTLQALALTTCRPPYSLVSLTLATKVGTLRYRDSDATSQLNVTTAVARLPSVMSNVVYAAPMHFNGVEQLTVALDDAPPQVFRFAVWPVPDAPYIHINGSDDGAVATGALPPVALTMDQDTMLFLPGAWVEDYDDSAQSWMFQIATTVGSAKCLNLMQTIVVTSTPTMLLFLAPIANGNRALQAMTYTPPKGYTGVATVTIIVRGTTSFLEHVRRLAITVTPVVTLPSLAVRSSVYKAVEDRSLSLRYIQLEVESWTPAQYATTAASTLFRSEVLRPDTASGAWGQRDDWRYSQVPSSGSNPQWFSTLGNILYYAADDPVAGRELFGSDGTRSWLVADIYPGYESATPTSLATFNGLVLFGASGLDLSWQLPVTTYGCSAARSSPSFPNVLFVVTKTTVWSPARVYDCPIGYTWMMTADATSVFNTSAVAVDYVYWNECGWDGYTFLGATRKSFRFADSSATGGMKHAGRRVDYPVEYSTATAQFAGIVCMASPATTPLPSQLWQTDGTTTQKVNAALTHPTALTPISSRFLFFQASTLASGSELYRYDGTTIYDQDLSPGIGSSFPDGFTSFAGQVYFAATTPTTGRELWVTSVSGASPWATNVAADINTGALSSHPTGLTACGSQLFFAADDGVHGRELYTFNGVQAALVTDLLPGSTGSDPKYVTCYKAKVYFQALGSTATGVELYVSDGTAGGTMLLLDIAPGVTSSSPSYLSVQTQTRGGAAISTLVFCSTTVASTCLWYGSDGSAIGTKPLWSTTTALAINPTTFQIGNLGSTMVFPLISTTTSVAPAPPTAQPVVQLSLNTSIGSVRLHASENVQVLHDGSLGLSGYWVLRGAVSHLNTALQTMVYRAPLNWNSKAQLTASAPWRDAPPLAMLTFTWSDIATALTDTASAIIFVQPTPDPPVLLVAQATTIPGTHTADNLSPLLSTVPTLMVPEDVPRIVSGLSIRAVDCLCMDGSYCEECTVLVAISVAHGTVSLPPTSGVAWAAATAPSTWHLSGNVPSVNRALSQLSYQGQNNYYGTDAMVLVVSVLQPLAISGLESTATMPVVVTPVNDVPYIVLGADYYDTIEDEALLLPGFYAVDADNDNVSVALTLDVGAISVAHNATIVAGTGNGDTTLVLNGSLSMVNAALSTLTYNPLRHWNSAVGDSYDTLHLRITDVGGLDSYWQVTIYVAPAPDTVRISIPTVAFGTATPAVAPSTLLYTMEGAVLPIANLSLSCVDAVATNVVTATLRVAHGGLSVGVTIGVQRTSSTPTVLQLVGTYARVNAALATLVYAPATYYNGADQLTVSATAYDEAMPGAFSLPGQRIVAISVLPVNNPPVWSLSEQTFVLDKSVLQQSVALDHLSFIDPDALDQVLELTLEATFGQLTLNPHASIALVVGAAAQSSYIVVRGTQTQLNLAMSSLQFELDLAAYTGAEVATVQPRVVATIDDLGNSGAGGPNVVQTRLFVRVTSIRNAAPVITLPALSIAIDEDTPYTLHGLVVTDDDAADTFGSEVQVTLACEHGHFQLDTSTAGLDILEEEPGLLHVQGPLELINYALQRATYVGALNYFGQDSIVVTANDLGNTGTGGPQQASATMAVVITSVCDPPTWASTPPALFSTPEDTPLLLSGALRLQDVDASVMDVDRVLTLSISVAVGGVLLATHAGLHVTASSTNDGVGHLYYSTATIAGTVDDLNAALRGLMYLSPADWTSDSGGGITYDRVTLAIRSSACASSSSIVLLVNVASVNDAPQLDLPSWVAPGLLDAAVVVDEDTVVALGPIGVTDVDATTLIVSVQCSSGSVAMPLAPRTMWFHATGSALLSFQGTVEDVNIALADVAFTPAPYFVGRSLIVLNVSDGTTLMTSATFTVTTQAVATPVQILVPDEPPVAMRNATTRLGNVYLPTTITALHLPPPSFTLFQSSMVQPDTKANATDVSTTWRSAEASAEVVSPTHFATFQGRLVFQATTPAAGTELMQTSGGVTTLLADLYPGPLSGNPTEMVVFSVDGNLYFAADGIDTSWRLPPSHTDTCGGLRRSSVSPTVAFVVADANTWHPTAVYDCPTGYAWATTAQGQALFVGTQGANGSLAEPLTYYDQCGWDGYTYGGRTRHCFWFADSGTTGACKHAGQRDSFRIEFDASTTNFAGIVCVATPSTPTRGRELWRTDGVVTSRVTDIAIGSDSANPTYLTEYNGQLYFQASTSDLGAELYTFDGTRATIVSDIVRGSRSSHPRCLTVYGGALFFTADSDVFGAELWTFDGTNALLVHDICTGVCASSPTSLVALPNWLLFQADDGVHGPELWKTNGVSTMLLLDIYLGPTGSLPSMLTRFGTSVYFAANDGVHGTELWVTDGNSANMLVDLVPGATSSSPQYFTVASAGLRNTLSVSPALYFAATTADGQRTLYASDGSIGGTKWVTAPVAIDDAALQAMPRPAFGLAQSTLFYPGRSPQLAWASVWNGKQPFVPLARSQSVYLVDVDQSTALATVSMSVSFGQIVIATTATRVTFVVGSNGVPSQMLTLQGAVPDLNLALRDILYVASATSTGDDTVALSVARQGDWLAPSTASFPVRLVST
ncbi:hypothetical protein SDRG_06940 [Saprolegnia diclina VS20]|uniref:Cadherin domain-containing protein n=1 Tax=Saprolegnia diclina (strain VS20) TaxID=1156394 RepID=T0QLQ2_SAPDV|nr:hypothetical protein SDRG_06940 [Saprolegnia diclina VS20]EQC35656.1 hypothetical protein SDRG_06940 [Saprolegnia diclina VS20]|eukprot:XP_008610973.1 hypothetical protein SDRG_06940 [Saprolegnia diclina VS20]